MFCVLFQKMALKYFHRLGILEKITDRVLFCVWQANELAMNFLNAQLSRQFWGHPLRWWSHRQNIDSIKFELSIQVRFAGPVLMQTNSALWELLPRCLNMLSLRQGRVFLWREINLTGSQLDRWEGCDLCTCNYLMNAHATRPVAASVVTWPRERHFLLDGDKGR